MYPRFVAIPAELIPVHNSIRNEEYSLGISLSSFQISNIFTDDRALKAQYRFYKQPFFIEKLKLEEPLDPNGDTFVMRTELVSELGVREKYELNVKTAGNRERIGWLSKLRQAIAFNEQVEQKNKQSCEYTID